MARGASIVDKTLAVQVQTRPKADAKDSKQVGAPIPGMVTSIACSVGGKTVNKGDKLVTLEAMKMYTTINAPEDGVVDEITVGVGDTVWRDRDSKDLLVRLR